MSEIKNINTVYDCVYRAFSEYTELARKRLHQYVSEDYERGFHNGLVAMRDEFLKQCPGLRVEAEE